MKFETATTGATTMTATPTFQTLTFSRWGNTEGVLANAARTRTVTARDKDHAQEIASVYGRQGWLLKDIVETDHVSKVFHVGPTYSGNRKWSWVFECTCGDDDAFYTKADANEAAKLHKENN